MGKPRLTKLGERDDIEAYLRTFERMMAVFEVERGQWSYMLAPQLTGKAQKAFAALEDGAAGDYDSLKAAILKRYGINEEAYRQRLRWLKKQSDESYRELAIRAMETSTKWLQDYGTREEVIEALTTEQLLNEMPGELKMWVRERKPRTSALAGELADDYVQAHRGAKVEVSQRHDVRRTGWVPPTKCYTCGQVGHVSPDCPRDRRPEERNVKRQEIPGQARTPQQAPRGGRPWNPPQRCYECGKIGHVATHCPSRAWYGEGRMDEKTSQPNSEVVCRNGTVEGRYVEDIILDTGCTRTLVHQDLIPRDMETHGEVIIRCAHGDEVSYPVAEVEITVGDRIMQVEAGVSHTLPVSVLLGTDVPQLFGMLPNTGQGGVQCRRERSK